MSQVIDYATSAMNDAIDDASTLLDDTVPLGEFLDEQLAKALKMLKLMKLLKLKNMKLLLCLMIMCH